jgi:hypothetical protein
MSLKLTIFKGIFLTKFLTAILGERFDIVSHILNKISGGRQGTKYNYYMKGRVRVTNLSP